MSSTLEQVGSSSDDRRAGNDVTDDLASLAKSSNGAGENGAGENGAAAKNDAVKITTTPPQKGSIVRLVIALLAIVLLCMVTNTIPHLVFVAALFTMVMLHELGHYLTAKKSGMKVTEFFFGFGPSLWSYQKGETAYGVKAFPLGGYVRIVGMHNLDKVDPIDEPRAYRQATFPRRLAVAVAGSTMHLLIAFVLLMIMFGVLGQTAPSTVIGQFAPVRPGETTAAQQAGLRKGDRFVTIDSRPIREWEDLSSVIARSAGRPIPIVVLRDGKRVTVTATPRGETRQDGRKRGYLGVAPAPKIVRPSPVGTITKSFRAESELVSGSTRAFARFFSPGTLKKYTNTLSKARDKSAPPTPDEDRFLSAVGATRIGASAVREGWWETLSLLTLINVSVAAFNMIPLLPLDGGHVVIAVYERIRSRRGRRHRVDVMKLLPLTYAVVAVMLLLGLTSLYLDVFRPIDPFKQTETATVSTVVTKP